MMPDWHVRLGSVDDIDAVYALNQQLFSEAWSKKSLLDVMQVGFDLYLCESGSQFAGYLLSQDILDEVHIMQVAVAPDFQRQGMARALTQTLLRNKPQAATIFLEVRASNQPAQALYASLGFTESGRRKGYYVPKTKGEPREDAVLMHQVLSSPSQ